MADERPAPPAFSPAAAIFLVLLAYLVRAFALAGGFELVGGTSATNADLSLVVVVAIALAALVPLYFALRRYAPEEPTAAALRLVRPVGAARGGLTIVLAVVIGASVAPATEWLTAAMIKLAPLGPGDPEIEQALSTGLPTAGQKALLVMASIAALPLGEEALYRGFILFRLLALPAASPARVLVFAALLYAIVAGDPRLIPGHFVFAVAVGFVAWRAKSIWASFAAHAAFQSVVESALMPAWTLAVGAGAGAAAAWALFRTTRDARA